ncbi:MAG: tetratricopeptide repeat protein [Acidobacteria bacterium]|uniref:non-specific serine/threonine protein kinase n=1 Tax=Candidatus Polarisedimenticola svalbardensis TaxID=2886004 RepID=A0A8J6Y5X7_9BACT|nr:tetratricopeptide repeat protein [Candidatus Polarisedimenticola svalbardensis]
MKDSDEKLNSEAPTMADDGASRSQASHAGGQVRFPVEGWARYKFESYLGGGGMGQVYKAFDPNLQRHVALKFILGDNPTLIQRFNQEARAQAQVDHERVCKVYEVGEVEGKPYIAMQYIDGEPLDKAAAGMTLEQKLLLLKEAARGLHAAHRNGLIHRDVKPANILVERSDTGNWKPYVMDFGLARAADSAGMTVTGAVLGTPHYMPPEQARGQLDRVDRRSDVYGLGASLYELLAGQPPFPGDTPTAVLMKVLEDVPETLNRPGSHVPIDVDAIVMKCLRKDPQERYSSARALAEDIQRYLDGEPVEARPTGMLYRLRMKAVKNKVGVTIGAVAMVLLMATVGWGAWTRWTAAKQARLAQEFGRQVERIEALARYSHTVPLHDVRPDRERIRDRMKQIESSMAIAGKLAEGSGQYALGRGYMALDSPGTARAHLESAWNAGYREPEVAYALGSVLGQIYVTALRDADDITDPAERQTRKDQIITEYREPALEYLNQSADADSESPEYVQALVAYYEERFDEALELARSSVQGRAWLYEANQLIGDVYLARANESWHGGAYEPAGADFDLAGAAYQDAVQIGESDPGTYTSLCALGRSRMLMELHARGEDVAPYYDQGLAACGSALQADPNHVDALVMKTALHNRMGEFLRNKGQDPMPDLHLAVETAGTTLGVQPENAMATAYIGAAYCQIARVQMDRGEDPIESLDRAVQSYERSLELDPNEFGALNDLGLVWKTRANHENNRGLDSTPSLEKAVVAYRRSLEINPQQVAALNNLGVAYFKLADMVEDPVEYHRLAIETFREALEINPNQMVVFYQLGRVLAQQAEHHRAQGEDPLDSLGAAGDAYRQAIEINPESAYRAHFYNGLAQTYHMAAEYKLEQDHDLSGDFDKAIEAYQESLAANPNLVFAHDNLGALYLVQAKQSIRSGLDPTEALAQAEVACRRALEIKPDYFFALLDLALIHQERARYEVNAGADPTTSLDRMLTVCREALTVNPGSVEIQAALDDGLRIVDQFLDRAPGHDAARKLKDSFSHLKA